MVTVLFAMLFQSVHIYEHISREESTSGVSFQNDNDFTEKFQKNNHEHDHCFACDFTFSLYTSVDFQTFEFFISTPEVPYFSNYTSNDKSFCGSLFSHRGPPFTSNC